MLFTKIPPTTNKTKKMTTEELLALHEDTSAKCRDIMRRKNNDYTGGQETDDPFANFNMSSSFGVHPALGVVLRIGDKLQRIRSFANDGALQVSGETIDDACEDIVNYAIIIKGIFRAEAAQRSTVALDDSLQGGWPLSNAPWHAQTEREVQLAVHIASLEELGREAGRCATEDYNKAKEAHYRQIYLDLAASKAAAAPCAYAASLDTPDYEPDDYGHHAAVATLAKPQYRLLEDGETIQVGDEFESVCGDWRPAKATGEVYKTLYTSYRRPLHA